MRMSHLLSVIMRHHETPINKRHIALIAGFVGYMKMKNSLIISGDRVTLSHKRPIRALSEYLGSIYAKNYKYAYSLLASVLCDIYPDTERRWQNHLPNIFLYAL